MAWLAELPFIGIIPRAAAQVSGAVGAGSSAISTATLASVATASLGATLMVNPIATPVPTAASASASPTPAAASVGVAASGSTTGSGRT